MEHTKKKAIYCNLLIYIGLVLVGTGLFVWVGLGPALAVPGFALTCLGVYGAVN